MTQELANNEAYNFTRDGATVGVPLSKSGTLALDSDIERSRYAFATPSVAVDEGVGVVALADRTISTVEIPSGLDEIALRFPESQANQSRDFYVRFHISAGVTAPAIALPYGILIEERDGESYPVVPDGGESGASSIVHFRETAVGGTFLVESEVLALPVPVTVSTFAELKAEIDLALAADSETAEANLRSALVGIEIPDTWTAANGTTVYDNPWIVSEFGWYKGEDYDPELDNKHLGALLQRKHATSFTVSFDNSNYEVAVEETAKSGIYYYGYTPAGYDSAATYDVNSIVKYNRLTYVCMTKVATAEEFDPAKWKEVDGTVALYDPERSYAVGDLCIERKYMKNAQNNWVTQPVVDGYEEDDYCLYRCTTATSGASGSPVAFSPGSWAARAPGAAATLTLLALNEGDSVPYSSYMAVFRNAVRDTSKNIIQYGSNDWWLSAWEQLLNSSGGVGEWWVKSRVGQEAPSNLYSLRGYMAGCSEAVLAAAKKVYVATWPNSVTNPPNNISTLRETLETFFLPSGIEVYGNVNPYTHTVDGQSVTEWPEGRPNEYWKRRTGYTSPNNTATDTRIIRSEMNRTSAAYCRLRSAYRGNSYYTWAVATSGYVYSYHYASNANAGAPACVIF